MLLPRERRRHEPRLVREKRLTKLVRDTVTSGGKVLIPVTVGAPDSPRRRVALQRSRRPRRLAGRKSS